MKKNIQYPKNLIKATLISSLVAPLPFVAMVLAKIILMENFPMSELIQTLGFFLIIMLFALPFTCTINFVLVLPMVLLLIRINSLSAIYLCLWSSLIAFPAFAIYMNILNGGSTREFDFLAITLSTLCGLCSGIVFCRIVKIRLKPHNLR